MSRARMHTAQRYACRGCGTEKVLPENPRTGPRTVRTGCPACGYITTHEAVGRVA